MPCVIVAYKSSKFGFSLDTRVLVFQVNTVAILRLGHKKDLATTEDVSPDDLAEMGLEGRFLMDRRIPYAEIKEVRLRPPDLVKEEKIRIRTRNGKLQYILAPIGINRKFGVRNPNPLPLTVLLGEKLVFEGSPTDMGKLHNGQ